MRLQFTRHVVRGADPAIRLALNTYIPPRQQPPSPVAPQLTIVCLHANSLHKETWEPIIRRLFTSPIATNIKAVHAWDARNHGDSAVLNREIVSLNTLQPFDWWTGAHDTLEVLDWIKKQSGDMGKIFGFGHSFGGAQLIMTELLRPGTFEGLVLAEPMVLTMEFMMHVHGAPYSSPDSDRVVQGALKRKAGYPTKEETFRALKGKPFFGSWDDESFQLYIDHAFMETTVDGKPSYQLKCTPVQEASTFWGGGSTTSCYARVHEMRAPTLFFTGKTSIWANKIYKAPDGSDTLRDVHLASVCPNGRHDFIDNAGHMIIEENPAQYFEKALQFMHGRLHAHKSKL